MTRTFLALIFLLLTAVACPAGQHPLTVTRTADDFYAAFDRDILIKTKFCSVRAFQEKEMSLEEALHLTNLSKSTFYRRIREQNER